MDNPTFKLEGVIKSKDMAEDFEGPLVLILHLLSKNKIEIKDIRISLILEQYLQYLDEMKQMDLEIASEFIIMASHLTYIKAKTLLAGDQTEITELEALQNSLEELMRRESYQKIKQVAAKLADCAEAGFLYFIKPPEALPKDEPYRYAHDISELRNAMMAIMGKGTESLRLPKNMVIPVRLVYPVGEKAEDIMLKLRDMGAVKISALFEDCSGRSELVATFMAVLELCKSGSILLYEENGEFIAANALSVEEV